MLLLSGRWAALVVVGRSAQNRVRRSARRTARGGSRRLAGGVATAVIAPTPAGTYSGPSSSGWPRPDEHDVVGRAQRDDRAAQLVDARQVAVVNRALHDRRLVADVVQQPPGEASRIRAMSSADVSWPCVRAALLISEDALGRDAEHAHSSASELLFTEHRAQSPLLRRSTARSDLGCSPSSCSTRRASGPNSGERGALTTRPRPLRRCVDCQRSTVCVRRLGYVYSAANCRNAATAYSCLPRLRAAPARPAPPSLLGRRYSSARA